MKKFFHELHRRSLWQVMGIYLGVSWGALQVVEAITNSAGLPDWAPGFALVLLVIGFPIVLATAFVQHGLPGSRGWPAASAEQETGQGGETGAGGAAQSWGADTAGAATAQGAAGAPAGTAAAPPAIVPRGGVLDEPATRSPIHHRLLTWRNAILGGVAAFALLGLAVTGYFVMRVTGIGPVAPLIAQGVIDAGEAIIIAEFENTSDDPALGDVVTEALRVDLAGSPALTPLAPARIQEALRLMQRAPNERLSPELARDVAIREGIRAVLEGEVVSAGSGYILLATLRSPEDQAALATFRRTARNPDELIDAIDKLSQDIREKVGESLKSIRAAPPLARVTTPSLEALRKYVEAERAHGSGDERRALVLAREAVALDSAFAMAYRKIAALEWNLGGRIPTAAAVEAATRAYELRDRLTELERYHTEAVYHVIVTGDVDAQMQAYERVLAIQPDDPAALNNFASVLMQRTRYEEAAELLERAVNSAGRTVVSSYSLVMALAVTPDPEGAQAALENLRRDYPEATYYHLQAEISATLAAGDYEGTHAAADRLAMVPDAPPTSRLQAELFYSAADVARGRLAESRRHLSRMAEHARALSPSATVRASVEHAFIERLYGSPEATRAALESALQALDSVPSEERVSLYISLADVATRASDAALARRVLDRWERDGPAWSRGSQFREMQQLVGIIETAATDPARAAAELEAFRAGRRCPRCYTFELGALHARAGQMQQAAAVWEEFMARPESEWHVGLISVLAHERLAETYDALGDRERAALHYARFAELWKDADPELQPRVRYARERAAALLAERG